MAKLEKYTTFLRMKEPQASIPDLSHDDPEAAFQGLSYPQLDDLNSLVETARIALGEMLITRGVERNFKMALTRAMAVFRLFGQCIHDG